MNSDTSFTIKPFLKELEQCDEAEQQTLAAQRKSTDETIQQILNELTDGSTSWDALNQQKDRLLKHYVASAMRIDLSKLISEQEEDHSDMDDEEAEEKKSGCLDADLIEPLIAERMREIREEVERVEKEVEEARLVRSAQEQEGRTLKDRVEKIKKREAALEASKLGLEPQKQRLKALTKQMRLHINAGKSDGSQELIALVFNKQDEMDRVIHIQTEETSDLFWDKLEGLYSLQSQIMSK